MIPLLCTSDTDLMSARAAQGVVRLPGGCRAWDDGLDALLAGPRIAARTLTGIARERDVT
ncbi:MAG: hypothetical protein ACYCV4_06995 [Dermatophilaceae bacterium]